MKPNPKGEIPLRERVKLSDEWDDFAKEIIPAGAPAGQRVEMRRAWYAGAAAMFGLMTGGLDADKEPTDLDIEYVESLSDELKKFSRDLGEGRA